MADLTNFFKRKNINPEDVGFRVGNHYIEAGSKEFLGDFFDSIISLDRGNRRWPTFLKELYMGHLPADHVATAQAEFEEIKELLREQKPDKAEKFDRLIMMLDQYFPYAEKNQLDFKIMTSKESLFHNK